MSREMLDQISDSLGRVCKNEDAPFGGIPVVLFGDLAQLGPFTRSVRRPAQSSAQDTDVDDHSQWIFFSALWRRFTRLELRSPCRHEQDILFFNLLEILRRGARSQTETDVVWKTLKGCEDRTIENPIELRSMNFEVEAMNAAILEKIPEENLLTLVAIDSRSGPESTKSFEKWLSKETGLPTMVTIFKGAKVIVTSNMSREKLVVNGTLATIVGYSNGHVDLELQDGSIYHLAREARSVSKGGHTRRQYPILLSYALTVHRAQGLTLDKVSVNLDHFFCSGQAYVALSRVRRLKDLSISGQLPEDFDLLFTKEWLREYI